MIFRLHNSKKLIYNSLSQADLTFIWNPMLQRSPLPIESIDPTSSVLIGAGLWHLAGTEKGDHDAAIEGYKRDLRDVFDQGNS